MSDREIKRINGSQAELERILAEIEEDLDSVMTQKNLSDAGKLHRELCVVSVDDLLRPFTIQMTKNDTDFFKISKELAKQLEASANA